MWRVIIADDEVHIRSGLKDIIAEMDLPLEVVGLAANGQEVLQLLDTREAELFILDICMPKLSGLALIEALRERRMNCEIIILSGYDEFAYAKQALQLRVGAYLLKPLDEEELYRSLASAIERLEGEKSQASYRHTLERILDNESLGAGTYSGLVREALELIERHYAEGDWDLGRAAQLLACHPDHLSRKLKQETGFSFKEHLTALRLQASLDLLRQRSHSVSEIAWRVGYSNAQYFATVFKTYFGCTPKSFYRSD